MNKIPEKKSVTGETKYSQQVGKRQHADSKLNVMSHRPSGPVWGMMGLVGWSVAVPTLLGAALGFWLDKHYPGSHSWTLMLLAAGLGLGCINAWHWVIKEDREMHEHEGDDHE